MNPDAIIRVRFSATSEGGRKGPIAIKDHPYGCVLRVGNDNFECRILVQHETLRLGESYDLPVKFLSPQLALPKIYPGAAITLWESKNIGSGSVLEVQSKSA